MASYAQKKVWIIGASSGIGASLAHKLHKEGASLILSSRSEDKLKTLNEDLENKHHVMPMDITDSQNIEASLKILSDKYERIDHIICLAAIYNPPAPIKQLDLEKAASVIDVNITGVLKIIHAVLPFLEKQNGGQLAITASVAGYKGLPNSQPYSATKAALINLVESLRAESPHNIDIRLINPGFVKTPMTDKNDFEMPMIISANKAANYIAKGLLSRGFEIHFPKRFTFILKLIKILPYPLYFPLARKLSP